MATKKTTKKVVAKAPVKKAVSPKKAVAPVKKVVAKPAAKPISKTAVKPAAKPISKKPAAKPVAKSVPAKPVKKVAVAKPAPKATKPAPKAPVKVAPKKAVAKKPIAKPVAKKVEKKEAPAPVPVKPVVKPVVKEKVTAATKAQEAAKALVTIKPKPQPVTKKEPPKPSKIVIPKTTVSTSVKYEPDFTKSVLDSAEYMHQGPIVRYTDTELSEFRDIINRKLDAAKKELNYLQGLITRKDQDGDMDEARYMTMEDGSVSMEREQLSQMASRQITFIDHLEKAIMRIENKTYGICRVTGKLIDKARLKAVPHATLSIEAKQMSNR